MRFAIGTVFCCSLLAAVTSTQSVGSEPSPMEAFASRQGVRTTWSNEIARWQQDGTGLVLVAIVLEDDARLARKIRGVEIDLTSDGVKDQVYLDERATERTRSALKEISDAVALTGMPGVSGCTGAKESWPGYAWPWNKYHELNVNFCGDSKNSELVLYGRGKPESFHFSGRTPNILAEILATATEILKQQVPEACPVTKPPAQPFVPAPPYWTNNGPDQFWYGTESLWTLLGVDGVWHMHSNVSENKGFYTTKLTYWQRGFDWRKEPEPALTVNAKRLDREAPIVAADPANAVFVTTDKPAMMTGIDIPIGCWEITARHSGHSLSFVVSVEP